jgi:hypothetical protein
MTARETVEAKAHRYLAEGRLVVTKVDADLVTAYCRGQGELYQLGHDPGRGWWCNCPVRTDRCAHLIALQTVTIRRAPAAPAARRPHKLPARHADGPAN